MGQFALIVIGVLVALYADSLREKRSERNPEAAYVADLLTELETSLPLLDRAIAADSVHVARARSMLTYLRSTGEAPQDSIREWRGIVGRASRG